MAECYLLVCSRSNCSHQTFQQEILHLFFRCQKKISQKKPPVRGQGKVRDRVRFRAWLAFFRGGFFPRIVFSHQPGINPIILQHTSLVFSFRYYLNDSTTFFLWLVFILVWNNRLPCFMKQRISNRLTTFSDKSLTLLYLQHFICIIWSRYLIWKFCSICLWFWIIFTKLAF